MLQFVYGARFGEFELLGPEVLMRTDTPLLDRLLAAWEWIELTRHSPAWDVAKDDRGFVHVMSLDREDDRRRGREHDLKPTLFEDRDLLQRPAI